MSVGYMSDGKLVTCATKDDLAAETAARENAIGELRGALEMFQAALDNETSERYSSDNNLQDQLDNFQIVLPIGEPSEIVDGSIWIVE